MKVSNFISIGIMALSLILTSCGSKTKSDSQPSSSAPKEYSAAEKTIGASGGEIKDAASGLGLNIPAGALTSDTNISAKYVEDQKQVVSNPAMGFLGAAEFQPSGTVFSKPVQVSIELTEAPTNTSISVFCYDETNKIWDFVTPASINGKTATFSITHFSKYQCLDITEAMYSKYIDLVNQAQAEGKSDSWITESYKDYLVNEKHVMDYYQEYNGYYYEPVGLFIGGQYQLNGKQGIGDDLSLRYGQSNKVGNTYGYSKVGGKTKTYAEAAEAMNKTDEKVDSIDITVTLDYKMIKPTIDLSSSKSSLKKGESADVQIYCHYAKLGNVIYPDFALPGYELTINQSTHLSTSTSKTTTNDSGKASFKVTSKDGEKDSLKVVFNNGEVSAEGFLTINGDESISFTGHIAQVINISSYGYSIFDYAQVDVYGSARIIVEYDFSGSLSKKDNSFNGMIYYSNFNADFSNSVAFEFTSYDDEGEAFCHNTYEVYQKVTEVTTMTQASRGMPIIGTINGETCSVDFIGLEGEEGGCLVGEFIGQGEQTDTVPGTDETFQFATFVGATNPLLDFSIESGTHTSSINAFKDSMDTLFRMLDEDWVEYTVKTTQTITIA